MQHVLKTWPGPFSAVLSGIKTHEVRKNDRLFALGDVLVLREFVPHEACNASGEIWSSKDNFHWTFEPCACPEPRGEYTGRECSVRVNYITSGTDYGFFGTVVMSVKLLPAVEPEP